MRIYENPQPAQWAELCRRAEQDNSLIAERVAASMDIEARKQGVVIHCDLPVDMPQGRLMSCWIISASGTRG